MTGLLEVGGASVFLWVGENGVNPPINALGDPRPSSWGRINFCSPHVRASLEGFPVRECRIAGPRGTSARRGALGPRLANLNPSSDVCPLCDRLQMSSAGLFPAQDHGVHLAELLGVSVKCVGIQTSSHLERFSAPLVCAECLAMRGGDLIRCCHDSDITVREKGIDSDISSTALHGETWLMVMFANCLPAVGREAAGTAEDRSGQEASRGAHQS